MTSSTPAIVLLNDTFPNPLAVLVALATLILPVVVMSWLTVRLVRKRPVRWPSPILALGLFVGLFVLAILADMRFPHVHAVESVIDAVASVLLLPGLMVSLPLGLTDSPASQRTAGQSANEHLLLAVGGTVFWYLMLLGWKLWMLRASEASSTLESSQS